MRKILTRSKKLALFSFFTLALSLNATHATAQNVINIGPCQLYDTDNGDQPNNAGYIAGSCNTSAIASVTWHRYMASWNSTTLVLDSYEPTRTLTPQQLSSQGSLFLQTLNAAVYGTVLSSAAFASHFQTTPNNGNMFIVAMDRPPSSIYPAHMAVDPKWVQELAVGTKPGFVPILTALVKTNNNSPSSTVTLISAKIYECPNGYQVANGPLPQVTGTLSGTNVGSILSGSGGAWGLGLYGSGTPGGIPALGVSSCKRITTAPVVK